MATPSVVAWGWSAVPAGSTAGASVAFSTPVTDVQFSFDQVTWHGIAAGDVPNPHAGGTVSVEPGGSEFEATLWYREPVNENTAEHPIWPLWVRGVNDDGTGPAFSLQMVVLPAIGTAGVVGRAPLGTMIRSVLWCGDINNYVVVYAMPSSVGGIESGSRPDPVDFGNGVTLPRQRDGIYVVRYSAQAATAAILIDPGSSGTSVSPESFPGVEAGYTGSGKLIIAANPYNSSTWRWRRNGDTGWTTWAGPTIGGVSGVAIFSVNVPGAGPLSLDSWWVRTSTAAGGKGLVVSRSGFVYANGIPSGLQFGNSHGESPPGSSPGAFACDTDGHILSVVGRVNTGLWVEPLTAAGDVAYVLLNKSSLGFVRSFTITQVGGSTRTIRTFGNAGNQGAIAAISTTTGDVINAPALINPLPAALRLVRVGGQNYVISAVPGTTHVEYGSGVLVPPGNPATTWIAQVDAAAENVLTAARLDMPNSEPFYVGSRFQLRTSTSRLFFYLDTGVSSVGDGFGFTHGGGNDGYLLRMNPSVPAFTGAAHAGRPSAMINEGFLDAAVDENSGAGWAFLSSRIGQSTSNIVLEPGGQSIDTNTHHPSELYHDYIVSWNSEMELGVGDASEIPPPDLEYETPEIVVPPIISDIDWPTTIPEDTSLAATVSWLDTQSDGVTPSFTETALEVRDITGGGSWISGSGEVAGGEFQVSTDAYLAGSVAWVPVENWTGTRRFAVRVRAARNGQTVYSPLRIVQTQVLDEPDPPEIVEAEFPDTWEDTPVTTTFRGADPDNGETHTWRLSAQTEEPYTTTSTSTVAVFDTNGETLAGHVSIVAGQGTLTPEVKFTPQPNYHGTYEGSVRLEDPVFQTAWQRFSGEVISVIDPPGPITPTTFGTILEDTVGSVTLSVTDGDHAFGDTGIRWEWEVSADGAYWRTDHSDGNDLVARLPDDDDDEDLSVTVQIEPRGNYHGPGAFWVRLVKTARGLDGEDVVYTRTARITGTIAPVPDAPSAPTPTRMPTVPQGQTASQTFTTTDPDAGDTATFQVRRVGAGSWSSSAANLGVGVGTFHIDQGSFADKRATGRFVPHPDFRGTYQVEMRVQDSHGLYSPAVRVTGVVSALGLHSELVRLERSTTSSTLKSLGPVHLVRPEITWGVKGPDGVRCSIEGARVRHLAEVWPEPVKENEPDGPKVPKPDAIVAPWSVELHVWGDGQLQFAGPISRAEYEPDTDTYSIDAKGLLMYTERREFESGAGVFTNVEQTEILKQLIDAEQARSYGDLLIETSTVTNTSQNRTVTFPEGSSIADVIDELQDQLDGPEVRITATRELRADLILCTDRRGTLVFNEANTMGLRLEEDGDELTTVAFVDGDGVKGSSSAGSAALARYGRITSRVEAKRVGTTAAANAAAARLISKRGFAGRSVRFTHVARLDAPKGRGAWDYEAGDTCTLEVRNAAGEVVRADGRIVNKSLRPIAGPEGGYLITLDVELLAPDGVVRPVRSAHNPDFLEQIYDAHRALR